MAGILDSSKSDGKTAIVTGCERGLGQGISIALAEARADISGVSHPEDAAETKAAVEKTDRRFVYHQANLLSIEPTPGIFEEAVSAFGHVDIVVNNAGIIKRNDSVDFTEQEWDDVMNINVKTVFFMCQAAAKQFVAQKSGGKIVNIASMLSFQRGPTRPATLLTCEKYNRPLRQSIAQNSVPGLT